MASIRESETGKPFMTQPVDKVVELYNGLFLQVRETKNTLTRWISNIFDKCEDNTKLIVDLESQVKILFKENDDLLKKINDLERDHDEEIEQIKEIVKRELYEELKEVIIHEVREEVMNATCA